MRGILLVSLFWKNLKYISKMAPNDKLLSEYIKHLEKGPSTMAEVPQQSSCY